MEAIKELEGVFTKTQLFIIYYTLSLSAGLLIDGVLSNWISSQLLASQLIASC